MSNRSFFRSATARAALSHTTASWPASRNARDSDASVVWSSSTMSTLGMGIGQFDMKRRAAAGLAVHPDLPGVIGDDGLHDGQAQAGAMHLRRVVRREQPAALLVGEPVARVAHVESDHAVRAPRANSERAAFGHRVDGVEEEILER